MGAWSGPIPSAGWEQPLPSSAKAGVEDCRGTIGSLPLLCDQGATSATSSQHPTAAPSTAASPGHSLRSTTCLCWLCGFCGFHCPWWNVGSALHLCQCGPHLLDLLLQALGGWGLCGTPSSPAGQPPAPQPSAQWGNITPLHGEELAEVLGSVQVLQEELQGGEEEHPQPLQLLLLQRARRGLPQPR